MTCHAIAASSSISFRRQGLSRAHRVHQDHAEAILSGIAFNVAKCPF